MSKSLGDYGELMVIAELTKRNLPVSIPWGDNQKYDLIVDADELHRVQVKCTNSFIDSKSGGCYAITSSFGSKSKSQYEKHHIDILIAYIIPLQVSYIIPVMAIKSKTIKLYPHRDNPAGFYEEYKERWNLLL